MLFIDLIKTDIQPVWRNRQLFRQKKPRPKARLSLTVERLCKP